MRAVMTKIAAAGASFVTYKVVSWTNLLGVLLLRRYFISGDAPEWAGSDTNRPRVVRKQRIGDWFIQGYPVVVALVVLAAFWNGRPFKAWRTALYLLALAMIGPLTFINYVQSDQFLNIWLQAGFNLFVAFVGYTLCCSYSGSPCARPTCKPFSRSPFPA